MRSMAAALIFLLMIGGGSAEAGKVQRSKRCLVEVLHSEELALAPLFYHTVRATLLVTAPDALPAEATIYGVIPWQVPPPRRGHRAWMPCDRIALGRSLGLF